MNVITRLAAIVTAAILVVSPAFAQKLGGIPAATTVNATDKIPASQNGTTAAITPAQLATYLAPTFEAKDADLDAIAALSTTAFGRSLLTMADAPTTRSALGLGSLATQSGTFSLAYLGGQPISANLTALSSLTTNADLCTYWTGSGTANTFTCTSFGRSLLASTGALSLTGTITASNFSGSSSGTNTGDNANTTGNAGTTTALQTGRTISTTGDVSYTSGSFNGTANVTGTATLAASGVTAATYGGASGVPSIAFDAKGRATTASNVVLGTAGGGTARTTRYPVFSAYHAGTPTTNFQTVGSSFTTIIPDTVTVDSAAGYSTSTGLYTVPETGIYFAFGRVRLVDNSTGGVNYGIGVDTTSGDSYGFFWRTTVNATQGTIVSRNGNQITRMLSLTAGQQLRLFMYSDQVAVNVASVEFSLYRLP